MSVKPYESPVPALGLVKWATNPLSSQWHPAIVTRRSKTAISVLVIPEEAKGGIPKDACLHCSDPRFAQMADQSSGVWDFTDSDKLLKLLARLAVPDINGSKVALTPEMAAEIRHLTK